MAEPPSAAATLSPESKQTPPRRHGITRWIIGRLALGLLSLAAAAVLVFAATQSLPGDAAQAVLGSSATPESLERLRGELNLDQSTPAQFASWVSGLARADFGRSLVSQESAGAFIAERLRNSTILLILASLIALPLSLAIGSYAALHRDGWMDKAALGITLTVNAIPDFVIGILLIVVFSTTFLTLLPAVTIIPPGTSPLESPDSLILPVVTLSLVVLPYATRLVRGTLIDVLDSQYIRMARYKGLSEWTVLFRHALPNALVPFVQGTAVILAYFLGGIVVVEFLFNYPGLGSGLTEAVRDRDVPVVQGIVLVIAASIILFNLVADIISMYLTPKVRTALRNGGSR